MLRWAASVFSLSIVLMMVFIGCAEEAKDVVARVGDGRITATQLRTYIDNLPEDARSDKAELDEGRDHLMTMIEMEIMLLEAYKDGIDKSPSFLKKMDKSRRTKLVDTYQKREIKVTIEEGDLEEYVKEKGYNRALRLADIMVADKDKAETVIKEIKAGKSFAEVAKKWSINKDTAARGGDLGRYSTRDQMVPIIRDHLYALAVGEVSDSIKIGDRYVLFKLLDDAPVGLKPQQGMKIQQEYHRIKFDLEKAALVEKLKKEYSFKLQQDGFDVLIEGLRRGASFTTEAERNTVLCSYDQGTISAGDFVDAASYFKDNVLAKLTTSEQAQSFAERNMVPDMLIMAAALRAGLDKEEKLAKWLVDQRKQLLVMELRAALLKEQVVVSDEEVKQYYDAHPERYLHPEHIEIEEVLVATKAEAIRLMEEIRKGALLGDLAQKHSIRSTQVRDKKGRFHLHLYEQLQFGGLVEVVAEAPIGELTGPVEVEEGYSIFKVLSKGRKRETFEEAGWRVRSHVTKEKNRQAFNQFIEELWHKYKSEVEIREDNLKAAFQMG
jgi:parvulin-like peptidyl-prolyl isomerase